MLYDEEEVLRICKKYGIETEVTEGYPTYMGEEINESFSIADIMYEPVKLTRDVYVSSEIVTLSIPVILDRGSCLNCYPTEYREGIVYKKDSEEEKIISSIPRDNENKYAA